MEEKFDSAVAHALENLQKSSLRLSSFQKDALKSIVSGKDTFVGLPTGHGKSILFECTPHCFDLLSCDTERPLSTVFVISPLIELMKSQVKDLCNRKQTAVRLSGEVTIQEEAQLRDGIVRYVFSSPEAVNEDKWKALLTTPSFNQGIKAVFVDEAHCVESWGTGVEPFRRTYSQLACLHAFLPSNVPFVALTATATNLTRIKICRLLSMNNSVVITTSPSRINLRYSVYHVQKDLDRFKWLLDELRNKQLDTIKTIVFCKSIAACAELYQMFDLNLMEEGYIPRGTININNALFGMYHAKVTDYEKKTLMHSFMNKDGVCRVLFCTIAFGMGMNIPNIYRVIHNGPSARVDQYVQESGRGGRDGGLCEIVLYLYPGSTRGNVSDEMKSYCRNNEQCRRINIMSHFPGQIQVPSIPHLCCDICASRCLCNCKCCCCCCSKKNFPCIRCCTCVLKCTYIPTVTVVGQDVLSQQPSEREELSYDEESSHSESDSSDSDIYI